jgi:MoxR-like ATPase
MANLRRYFGLDRTHVETPAASNDDQDAEDPGLTVTGESLISSIHESIRLRRSVLVTGPRGCGKTHCCEVAIRRARDHGLVGGWRFLQGNREIPRDTLSEDMLVVADGGKVELLKALALRPLDEHATAEHTGFPDWPGIPTQARSEAHDPRTLWTARDWVVLFLDEINRFGDGFLDSLLSLIEEGKIVRRGQDYYVPIVVVATANPPGYDVTAKKLSPPLQARISRAFRVSQPDAPLLAETILAAKIADFERHYPDGQAPRIERSLRYLAAGATLCLWGDPDSGTKGRYYLTTTARQRLRTVMQRRSKLADAMRGLSDLIDFGPDARAVADWVGAAMALAARHSATLVTVEHLERCAVEVLSHKLRERFNEGTDPQKGIEKERLLLQIVREVLGHVNPRAFGFEPEPVKPTLVRPTPMDEAMLRPLTTGFANAKAFVDALVAAHRSAGTKLLHTPDLALVWLNMVDAVLHPFATPEGIREVVQHGFWTLYRTHRPGPQLDPVVLGHVSSLCQQTFDTIGAAANSAGRERVRAASSVAEACAKAALASPSHPRNTPGRSGPGGGPVDW